MKTERRNEDSIEDSIECDFNGRRVIQKKCVKFLNQIGEKARGQMGAWQFGGRGLNRV